MQRFLVDENVDNAIVDGLLSLIPALDIIRVQEVGLVSTDDRIILERAAQDGRILLSRDRRTMINYAFERVRRGQRMSGVFIVRDTTPIGQVIEELQVIAEASHENEWENRVAYLPLK